VSVPVLICDDSGFARKQMARAIPDNWDVNISYAANGKEGVDAIKSGKGELLFLDLNMPEMDGYEVLEVIRKEDLPSMVIVVSGDVQPEAKKRVINLGATWDMVEELPDGFQVKSDEKLSPWGEESIVVR